MNANHLNWANHTKCIEGETRPPREDAYCRCLQRNAATGTSRTPNERKSRSPISDGPSILSPAAVASGTPMTSLPISIRPSSPHRSESRLRRMAGCPKSPNCRAFQRFPHARVTGEHGFPHKRPAILSAVTGVCGGNAAFQIARRLIRGTEKRLGQACSLESQGAYPAYSYRGATNNALSKIGNPDPATNKRTGSRRAPAPGTSEQPRMAGGGTCGQSGAIPSRWAAAASAEATPRHAQAHP